MLDIKGIQLLLLTDPASIRILRHALDIQLQSLAEACTMSISNLNRVEQSDPIKNSTAKRIARGFIYVATINDQQDALETLLKQQRDELESGKGELKRPRA